MPIQRNKSLDGLRAVSILLVIFSHYVSDFIPGGLGVNVFFAISGFVITLNALAEIKLTGEFNAVHFLARRLAKILPGLIVFVAAPSIAGWLFCQMSPTMLPSQILLYYNWEVALGNANGLELPGSNVVWSLSVEEQFYLAFALIITVLARSNGFSSKITALCLILCLAVPIWKIWLAAHGASMDRLYFGTDSRLDSIAWGVALAASGLVTSEKVKSEIQRWLALILCVSLVFIFGALLWQNQTFQTIAKYSIESFFIVVIMFCFSVSEPDRLKILKVLLSSRPAQFLAKISYCLYLAHLSIFQFLAFLDHYLVRLSLSLTVSVILAWLVTKYIEHPIVNKVRKMNRA